MIDSAQIVHLHLMADMEEVKKKMDQDVNAIAKLQKDLKQALQERISLQEKLSEVRVFLFFLFFFFFLFSFFFLRVNVVVSFSFLFFTSKASQGGGGGSGAGLGLHSQTSINRKPSMRSNWQGGTNEKKAMQDMRSLQQVNTPSPRLFCGKGFFFISSLFFFPWDARHWM